MVSERTKRGVVLVVLGVVLAGCLVTSTLAVGLDRTVLDAETTTEAVETDTLADEVVDGVSEDVTGGEDVQGLGLPVDEIVTGGLENADLASELEGAIEQFYAYLHGDSEELEVTVNTVSMKDGIESETRTRLTNRSATSDRLPEIGGVDVGDMTEGPAEYEETQAEFDRQYPPYDGREDRVRAELVDELGATVDEEGVHEDVRDEVIAYGVVYVDALVYDQPYETFETNEAEAREDLADAGSSVVRDRLDEELADEYDALSAIDEDDEGTAAAERARTGVSIVGYLALFGPLASVGIAGLVWRVSARRSTALFEVGGITLVVGLAAYGTATVAEGRLVAELERALSDQPALAESAAGLVSTTASTFATLSLALLGIGAIGLGGAAVLRSGLVDVADVPGSAGREGRTTGSDDARAGSTAGTDSALDADANADDGDAFTYDETTATTAEPLADEVGGVDADADQGAVGTDEGAGGDADAPDENGSTEEPAAETGDE